MSGLAAAPGLSSLLAGHWQSAWPLDAAAAMCAGAYAWGIARAGPGWPARRALCFAGGLAAVLLALQSGIGAYDDQLLSVHMVQHMLLLMVAPVLLLEGRPLLLALRALPRRRRAPLAKLLERAAWLGSPLLCVGAFSAALIVAHVPPVFDATLRDPLLHEVEHAMFLVCGVLLWWPLLDADPVPRRRLGGLGRIVYMLATMPAMALVGAWLNRAPSPVYHGYVAPARALGISAVSDQQHAGAIMWVGGSTFMIAVGLWAAMAAMVAEERRRSAHEARARAVPPPARSGMA
jgi:cytochrome c oxidase assembly factor CtaG